MISIDIREFMKMPEGEEKRQLASTIRHELMHGVGGRKMWFQNCGNDVRNAMRVFAEAFEAEDKVIERLNRLNPGQNWRAIDPNRWMFMTDYVPSNEPDLINDFGETIEVKAYKLRGSSKVETKQNIKFSEVTPEKFYRKYFHGAD